MLTVHGPTTLVVLALLWIPLPVAADWLFMFSADELPTRILPGAGEAAFSCRPAALRPPPAPPTDDLDVMASWTSNSFAEDVIPSWARAWRDALRPLSGFVGRVRAQSDGTYRYLPLTDGAVSWLGRSRQSDSKALSMVQDLQLWITRPSTLLEPAPNEPIGELQQRAVKAYNLAWQLGYVARQRSGTGGLPSSATYAVSEVIHDYFFPQPVFFVTPPSANQMRDRIARAHERATAALRRFSEQDGEYSNLKRLDAAVGSIGRPDVQRESDRIKEARQAEIQSRMAREIAEVLRGARYIGAGVVAPSVLRVSDRTATGVSGRTEDCGVTELEARAIAFLGDLARQQALTYIARELGTDAVIGADASEADESTKAALRVFYAEASSALARRAAYEFFWVFSYKLTKRAGGGSAVQATLEGTESAATRRAFAAAEVLLTELRR